MRKRLAVASAALVVVSIVGLMASWELIDTVWDKYDAYGEVPIPGTRTLHLPEDDVKVSFHTEIAGTMEGGGLPIPRDLEVAITGPSGLSASTAGDYTIAANGKASADLSPRLSFGDGSSYGFLTWAFVALGGASLLTLLALLPSALVRARRVAPPKRKTALQQLDDIAALHDSGALSDEEYEAPKRQPVDGL